MKLNDYFNLNEFRCKCGCEEVSVDTRLLEVLTDVRTYFNLPIKVNSGFRCVVHNKSIHGSSKSKHLIGIAADIVVKGLTSQDEVADYLLNKYSDTFGIGRYNGRTHIDVREKKARWDNR
ncbi:MAG: D-Ala-D-Ala carboxypeptidase family metallohydrolase [Candidatus Heimdallarchaeota archaeon]